MNQPKEEKKNKQPPTERNLEQSLLYNMPLPNGNAQTLDTTRVQTSPNSLQMTRQLNSNAFAIGNKI